MRVPMEVILPSVLGTQVEHIYISNHGQGGLSGRGGASPLDLSRPEFHPLFGRRSAQRANSALKAWSRASTEFFGDADRGEIGVGGDALRQTWPNFPSSAYDRARQRTHP